MLKTAALKQRAILSRLANGYTAAQTPLPAQGNVSAKVPPDAPRDFYFHLGFPVFLIQAEDGTTTPIAIRADMVERVNSAVYDKAQNGVYTFDPALASTIGTSVDALQAVLHGLGFRYEDKLVEPDAAVTDPVAPIADEATSTENTPAPTDTTLANSEIAAQPDAMVTADTPDADPLANSEVAAQPDTSSSAHEPAAQDDSAKPDGPKTIRVYHLKKALPFFLRPSRQEHPREDRPRSQRPQNDRQPNPRRDATSPAHDGERSFSRDKKADFEQKFKPKQSPGQFNKKPQDRGIGGNSRDNVVPVKAAKPTGHQAFAGLADLQSLLDAKKK